MSSEQKSAAERSKRTLRRRSRKSSEHLQADEGASDAAISQDDEFRIWFLAKETGITSDQASEIILGPAKDGASMLIAARSLKVSGGDQ